MINRNFLLTFDDSAGTSYAWFETEEEMNDYIEERGDAIISINDKIEIVHARNID